MQLAGKVPVNVQFKGREARLELYVVTGGGASLLGRDRFPTLEIKVSGVHSVSLETHKDFIANHKQVFRGQLDGHIGEPLHIDLKQNAAPKFLKSRPVPLALQS